jgi:hypothetical protein
MLALTPGVTEGIDPGRLIEAELSWDIVDAGTALLACESCGRGFERLVRLVRLVRDPWDVVAAGVAGVTVACTGTIALVLTLVWVAQWTDVGTLVLGPGSCETGRGDAVMFGIGSAPRGLRPRLAPMGAPTPVAMPLGRPRGVLIDGVEGWGVNGGFIVKAEFGVEAVA